MTEIWRKYEDTMYLVSSWGNVKSQFSGVDRYMKPQLSRGYYKLNLAGKTKVFIHRMVAAAFLGKDATRPFINHKNGIKTDNRVENLEWCTVEENNAHAAANGLGNPAKPCYVINLDNEILGRYDTQPKARAVHGYKRSVIIIFESDFTDEYRLKRIAETPTERKKVDTSERRSLNKFQVDFIRKSASEKTYTQKYLGQLFNLDQSTVSSIVSGHIYSDILTK